jgi:localization factor PodJL
MHNLAVLSAGRPGVRPDYPSAVRWFTEAANRGLADSQYNLGILYESGLGVPASNIEAYKWYALAARSGDKDAAKRRDLVRQKLDAASTKTADVLVIQWRATAVEAEANDTRSPGQTWQAVRQ